MAETKRTIKKKPELLVGDFQVPIYDLNQFLTDMEMQNNARRKKLTIDLVEIGNKLKTIPAGEEQEKIKAMYRKKREALSSIDNDAKWIKEFRQKPRNEDAIDMFNQKFKYDLGNNQSYFNKWYRIKGKAMGYPITIKEDEEDMPIGIKDAFMR